MSSGVNRHHPELKHISSSIIIEIQGSVSRCQNRESRNQTNSNQVRWSSWSSNVWSRNWYPINISSFFSQTLSPNCCGAYITMRRPGGHLLFPVEAKVWWISWRLVGNQAVNNLIIVGPDSSVTSVPLNTHNQSGWVVISQGQSRKTLKRFHPFILYRQQLFLLLSVPSYSYSVQWRSIWWEQAMRAHGNGSHILMISQVEFCSSDTGSWILSVFLSSQSLGQWCFAGLAFVCILRPFVLVFRLQPRPH